MIIVLRERTMEEDGGLTFALKEEDQGKVLATGGAERAWPPMGLSESHCQFLEGNLAVFA